VEEFMRMGEAHVFGHEARIELIEGQIVEMAPISSAHASVVCRLDTLLRVATPQALVSVQRPLVLSQKSAPKPDVLLLRPPADEYYSSHPPLNHCDAANSICCQS
jgi:Uma2 family endonuclease